MATIILGWFADLDDVADTVTALTEYGFTRNDINVIRNQDDIHSVAERYELSMHEDAILMAVRALGDLSQRATTILRQHGAAELTRRPFSWREQGLDGFDVQATATEVEILEETRQHYDEELDYEQEKDDED